jgi:5-methylcytosine-specific restriction protein A
MPTAALKPCAVPSCPALVSGERCPDHARQLEQGRPHRHARRWYNTVRWKRLRVQVLADALHTCARCGQVAAALEVDHDVPHRGDPVLFWDRANLQALCASCHAQKTNAGE